MTAPVQPCVKKIGVGVTDADSIVWADGPTLVTLTTLLPTEFNWTLPKSNVAGTRDRVLFGWDDVETPAHAVRSNDRAKVSKTDKTTR